MEADDILNLTFFPKGAILTFSTAAWGATSAEFKNIWKICNTANHDADPNNVPDLTNRFLRGGTNSDFTTGGGADSQSVTLTDAHLPEHKHAAGNLSLSDLQIVESGSHEHTLSGKTASDGLHTHGHNLAVDNDTHGHSLRSGDYNESSYSDGLPYSYMVAGRSFSDRTRAYYEKNLAGEKFVEANTHKHDLSGGITNASSTHEHSFSSDSKAVGGTHTHSITGGNVTGDTESAGVARPAFSVNTVPAYYTVIYIIKVV
jgi:hypothetical protein